MVTLEELKSKTFTANDNTDKVSCYVTATEMRRFGGNEKLMAERNIPVPSFDGLTKEGKTPLYFAAENKFLGVIAAADVLKADSRETVEAMEKLHLDVVMLTGDNEQVARSIAAQAGIRHVISDVLPGDKAGAIKKLQAEGRNVLMVGDGINDAPALVTADVGMAIGAGTDIAMESANVVLMSGSLGGIADAVRLSKATIRNIRQNLFWAFFYNCLGIPIAAGVLIPIIGLKLSPMLGAAAMSMSSVFVVTNALRLRKWKPAFSREPEREESITHQIIQVPEEETKMETNLKITGMMCPHCQAHVDKALRAVAGVTEVTVDLAGGKAAVVGGDPAELVKAVVDAGYEAEII